MAKSIEREIPVKQMEEVVKVQKQNNRERSKESNLINKEYIREKVILPIEEKERIEQEYERINAYVNFKEERLEKEWNKKNSKLKLIGDYLYKKLYDFPMVSKSEISKEFKISIWNIDNKISKLNFYRNYPLTIIPVYGKRGYVQAITKNEWDAIKWERQKFRTIESMSYIKEKGEMLIRKLIRIKPKQKNKKQKEEIKAIEIIAST